MSRRAVIYARISRDRVGAGLGVERQESDCRELAERLGWQVVAVHTDNDISAFSGKKRPGYLALLDDLKAGRADAVVAWHTDRLHRSPVELERYIGVCGDGAQDIPTHCVKAGPLDLTTASGRMHARISGAVARHEVEHMIERQRAAKAQAAAAGKWRGGRRPFGYESDGVTVRPTEAAIVAECAERILAGESLSSVARELNERGVSTSTGASWKSPELRRVLMRARNAGLVEHEGQEVATAEWEPILDPAVWRNVRRLLTAEGRRPPRSADTRWLGSGLYLCGVCNDGTTMLSAATRSRTAAGGKVPAYRCRRGSHLTRVAEPLDTFVTEVVLERLSRPDARLLLAPEGRRPDVEALHAERADVAARLDEVAALFADGDVTGPQLVLASSELRARHERINSELAAATAVSPLAGIADALDVRVSWDAASISRRKAVVRALADVTLMPAAKGRPAGWRSGAGYFDPRFVQIEWRQ